MDPATLEPTIVAMGNIKMAHMVSTMWNSRIERLLTTRIIRYGVFPGPTKVSKEP